MEVPCSDTNISIGWFIDNCPLTNSTDVTITTQTQSAATNCRIQSNLTIENLNDSYAGRHTCNIVGGDEFMQSKPLNLLAVDALLLTLAVIPCAQDFVHTVDEMKCARFVENQTIPITPSCTARDIIKTSLPSESSSTISSNTVFFPMPSSTMPTNTTSDEVPISDQSSRTIWPYIVIPILVVFFASIIIIVLVILVARKSPQKGTRSPEECTLNCELPSLVI